MARPLPGYVVWSVMPSEFDDIVGRKPTHLGVQQLRGVLGDAHVTDQVLLAEGLDVLLHLVGDVRGDRDPLHIGRHVELAEDLRLEVEGVHELVGLQGAGGVAPRRAC